MFRDKPTAYDRISDTLSDIGERIAALEEQVVDRVVPQPSRAERMRRSVSRHLPHFHSEPTGLSRYMPEFLTGLSVPTGSDVQRHISSLRESASEGVEDARGYLSDIRRHLPELPLPRAQSFRRGTRPQRGIDYLRDRPELTALLVVGGAVAVVGTAYFVTKKVQEHAEEPEYDVIREDGPIEIRDYDAMVVAETVKSGYHEKARRVGFQALADYIFARNRPGKKIKMTTPVLQQLSEGDGRTKGWAVRFVMPKKFTLASLPAPGNDEVSIKEVPARRIAAIRFSGNFNATLASKQLMSLYNYLADNNLKQKGDPEYAFYNPPWTPGFMKRNEILIEIER